MNSPLIDQCLIEELANSDSEIRSNALEKLEEWIKNTTTKKAISEETLKIISKGLYYTLWMQDKALLHEDLCDRIVIIHDLFKRAQEQVSYYFCLLSIIDQNILSIDKWRINKFLMLVRRIFRNIFNYVSKKNWNRSVCQKYIDMIDINILNTEEIKFSNVMISHIVSVFMDEFDKALNVVPSKPEEQFLWYTPFLKALENKNTSDYIFERITKEIFGGILLIIEMENSDDAEIERSSYHFPIVHISDSLFNIAKSDNVKSKRRKVLYNMVEKFKLVEKKYKQ